MRKINPGSPLRFSYEIAQPIQPRLPGFFFSIFRLFRYETISIYCAPMTLRKSWDPCPRIFWVMMNLRLCNVLRIRMNLRIWRLREFHRFFESRPELLRSRQLLWFHQLGRSPQKFPEINMSYYDRTLYVYGISKLTKALSKCLAIFSRWLIIIDSAMIMMIIFICFFDYKLIRIFLFVTLHSMIADW